MSDISNSQSEKDTGAWLRPIELLYWHQSKESNDTLLWKLSRNVKNAFALFCCCHSHQRDGARIRKQSRNRCDPVHSAPLAVPSDSGAVGVGLIKQAGSLAVAATPASLC